jgi:hypothetical protein
MSSPNHSSGPLSTWPSFSVLGWRPTDPRALSLATQPTLPPEHFDIVTIRYRDAACGRVTRDDVRDVLIDHAWQLPRGAEPTHLTRDLTGEPPMTCREAIALAERAVTPLRPPAGDPSEDGEEGTR